MSYPSCQACHWDRFNLDHGYHSCDLDRAEHVTHGPVICPEFKLRYLMNNVPHPTETVDQT
jgi:hypothetical protein